MNDKFINIIILTTIISIIMILHYNKFELWDFIIIIFVIPNLTIIIWLIIEWIKFNSENKNNV